MHRFMWTAIKGNLFSSELFARQKYKNHMGASMGSIEIMEALVA